MLCFHNLFVRRLFDSLRRVTFGIALSLTFAVSSSYVPSAHATEHGMGMYLMGSKGPMAGVVPAPGLYFQNDVYYYQARAGANTPLPMGGRIGLGIKARALIDVPTVIWAVDSQLLGAQPVLTLSQPMGYQRVEADVTIGPRSGSFHGSVTTLGDPIAGATLGWNSGSLHWSSSAMVNIPVGHYRKNSMANLSFNHWAVDLSMAATWFNPALGWDISGAAGVTINGRNPATQYKSGRELHLEAAVSKYLSPRFSVGVMGYHYQQVSADKGAGATLGSFKGRVSALGPTASYTFNLHKKPVSLRLKLLREFAAKNRLKGTAGFITLSMPF